MMRIDEPDDTVTGTQRKADKRQRKNEQSKLKRLKEKEEENALHERVGRA